MKLAVLISGGGTNLQAFIDRAAAGQLGAEIAAVISNRADAFGLERARRANIPAAVVSHRDFERREDFDQALLDTLAPYGADLVVLAGFMRVLTPVFITPYEDRLMNLHPSLLPKYPGLHSHQQALDAGDAEAGATVHFVTTELDAGPPIIQARVPVLAGDDAERLEARVREQEHRIYPLAVKWFAEGRLRFAESGAELDGEPLGPYGFQFQPSAEEPQIKPMPMLSAASPS